MNNRLLETPEELNEIYDRSLSEAAMLLITQDVKSAIQRHKSLIQMRGKVSQDFPLSIGQLKDRYFDFDKMVVIAEANLILEAFNWRLANIACEWKLVPLD